MRTRKATPLGDALASLVDELGIGHRIREYDVVAIWPRVVGKHIASVAEVKSIRNGILVIRVSHPAWRQELLLRRKELIGNINAEMRETVVRDIQLI